MSTLKLSVSDPEFVDKIIFEVKSQGHFDMFRKECLADVGECVWWASINHHVEKKIVEIAELVGRSNAIFTLDLDIVY